MNSSNQIASIDWFFRTPSAANFPQIGVSPALSSLQRDFAKLTEALLISYSEVPSHLQQSWLASAEAALEFNRKFQDNFSSETASVLVKMLKDILKQLQLTGSESTINERVFPSFRSTLASLIVYAKESKDYHFKKDVLDLVVNAESLRLVKA